MTSHATNDSPPPPRPDRDARVIPLRPAAPAPAAKEPLWRDVVGAVLRRERLAQERTLKDVADAARISVPYLSEVERGRKEASSEVLAAAAHALGLGLGDLLGLAHHELTSAGRRARGGLRGPGASLVSRTTAPQASVSRLSSGAPLGGGGTHQGRLRLAA
ncbi:helix-turn-helix domain-containing protein [Streptomyces sp. AN091965]|uniref:helix-turn-helix domain-containing protein n=1 Tax=Streptomyces sp. AN091965 TaxID=2927803 RepID=UPI0035A886F9